MIIGFLKNNNPAFFILLPLFALVLWAIPFFSPTPFAPQQIMPLYELMVVPLLKTQLISSIVSYLFVIIGAFLLNYICTENELFIKQTFLPALFYTVLMSINNTTQALHPIIISNVFLLLTIAALLSSYRKDYAFSNAFNAGAALSISILFYFPNIFYIPVIAVALIILRPFKWREWVISLLGILTPFIFICSYYFWNDKLLSLLTFIRSCFHFVLFTENQLSAVNLLPVIIGGIILLLSLSSLLNLSSNSQKAKKSTRLFVWFALFGASSFSMAPSNSIVYFSALAIPFSVFYTNYFLITKKAKWMEFLFFVFLASILFQQVYNFL